MIRDGIRQQREMVAQLAHITRELKVPLLPMVLIPGNLHYGAFSGGFNNRDLPRL
jgi:hypothetical protein